MAHENKTKYAVLGLLSWRGPLSGYQVKQAYEVSAGFFWNVSFGQIYPTLKQLEAEGFATSTIERTENRPESRVYAITDKGRAALREWLEEPTAQPVPRNELLLKFIHGFREPSAVMLGHVRRLRERTEAGQRASHETLARIRPVWTKGGLDDAETLWLLAVRYAELVDGAVLRWCREATKVLEAREAEVKVRQRRGGKGNE
jgi:DNA-binding PadR family transcriptional regulator